VSLSIFPFANHARCQVNSRTCCKVLPNRARDAAILAARKAICVMAHEMGASRRVHPFTRRRDANTWIRLTIGGTPTQRTV
jgi:hypothetical protein